MIETGTWKMATGNWLVILAVLAAVGGRWKRRGVGAGVVIVLSAGCGVGMITPRLRMRSHCHPWQMCRRSASTNAFLTL